MHFVLLGLVCGGAGGFEQVAEWCVGDALGESKDCPHPRCFRCRDIWDRLKADARAVMVDVRTKAEWAFVGVPDLVGARQAGHDGRVADVPGQPGRSRFRRKRLSAALSSAGVGKDDEVFFICRSGGRSRMAAEVLRRKVSGTAGMWRTDSRGHSMPTVIGSSGRRLEGRRAPLGARAE